MFAKFSVVMEGSTDSLSSKCCEIRPKSKAFCVWCISIVVIVFLVLAPTMGSSPAVLLTPGRTRNIAQDMEALRMSRQDNPYLQV